VADAGEMAGLAEGLACGGRGLRKQLERHFTIELCVPRAVHRSEGAFTCLLEQHEMSPVRRSHFGRRRVCAAVRLDDSGDPLKILDQRLGGAVLCRALDVLPVHRFSVGDLAAERDQFRVVIMRGQWPISVASRRSARLTATRAALMEGLPSRSAISS
jgi:hypothetical protein